MTERIQVPWELSESPAPGKGVPNMPTPEGIALGVEMARLCDIEEAKQLERFPDQTPRCDDCALRRGTRPNGCAETQMDALKCVLEGIPFYCHKGIAESEDPKRLCAGWVTLTTAGATSLGVARCLECHRSDGQHNSRCPNLVDGARQIDLRKVELLAKARGLGKEEREALLEIARAANVEVLP